ncbi:MAG TPA: transcription termination/antitermination NusG family protein [Candidatus Polarisedimenticolia bacterium]|nr:transcription termination/antitermination NusG family protein [Candidatus Polarisedimenticolia bacterium]
MIEVANWHVLQTRSQWEQQVHDALAAAGYEVSLPRTRRWTTPDGEQRGCGAPLFPGYLFVRGPLDRDAVDAVRRTRGVIAIVGHDRPLILPDAEMETIRRIVDAGVGTVPHAFLCVGRRVRVLEGSLGGVTGILARSRPEKALFVMSFPVLKRSLAVEMEAASVEPLDAPVALPQRRDTVRTLPVAHDPQQAA